MTAGKCVFDNATTATPLTADEELAYLRAAHNGCGKAREQLILCNQRLVWHIARGLRQPRELLRDLFQDGILGLIVAIERWQEGRGHRFANYAAYWIRQAIQNARKQQGTEQYVRRPNSRRRPPRQIYATSVQGWYEDPPIRRLLQQESRHAFRIAVTRLSLRQRQALEMRLAGMSRGEITQELQCSRHYVNALIRAAVSRLHKQCRNIDPELLSARRAPDWLSPSINTFTTHANTTEICAATTGSP
jgi:RNA polymerase sigma factor (sigma-70 family)